MAARIATKKLLHTSVFAITLSLMFGYGVLPVSAAGATLSLSPATINVATGQTFTVAIQLDTGGAATDGARTVLLFDPTKLTAGTVTPGTIYQEYPANAQTVDNNQGVVKVSGIADTSQTYTGAGTLATVSFTAKAAGSTQINFDYTAGSTTDSNVADSSTYSDILSGVTGATVTIGGSAIASGSAVGGSKLPNTASMTPTMILAMTGGIFLLFGTSLYLFRLRSA